jgi:hypothetical protein
MRRNQGHRPLHPGWFFLVLWVVVAVVMTALFVIFPE